MNFDDMRPYRDNEVDQKIEFLVSQPDFESIVPLFKGIMNREELLKKASETHTVDQFQRNFSFPLLKAIDVQLTKGVQIHGLENAEGQATIFMTNHRDIVMDSALINYSLLKDGKEGIEIAIGDNLFATPSIEAVVRLNRSFVVHRTRDINYRLNLKKLSAYVEMTIRNNNASIWISQREGRAKDSNDTTSGSILKMFTVFGEGTMVDKLKNLHICPTTISYEYDPCDYLKAKEFQQKRDDENFVKSKKDDVESMQTGIWGYKGEVHIEVAPCINARIDELQLENKPRSYQTEAVRTLIDQVIFSNYHIYTINKVCYDILFESTRFQDEVTEEEKQKVLGYLNKKLDLIDLPSVDRDYCKKKILEMYANPLKNYLSVQKCPEV